MPVGACLIAGKHQSMLDVIAPFAVLPGAGLEATLEDGVLLVRRAP